MTTRTLALVARYALGAGFLLFGLNGFFHFLPDPPPPPAAALNFVTALFATGYMIPLIKGTEVVAALLLLGNRFVPLALTLLAPVLVNIMAYHLILAPGGLVLPVLLLAAELYLAWSYRDVWKPMLAARVEPTPAAASGTRPRAASAAA